MRWAAELGVSTIDDRGHETGCSLIEKTPLREFTSDVRPSALGLDETEFENNWCEKNEYDGYATVTDG